MSAVTGDGLDELWAIVEKHRETLSANGELDTNRRAHEQNGNETDLHRP